MSPCRKTEDHQLAKMMFHTVSIPMSRLLCCWLSLHMMKCSSIIRKNVPIHLSLLVKMVTKMVLQMVSIHMSRLLCCWHSLHISKSLSIPTQNLDLAIEHVDSTLQTIMCTKHLCSYQNIHDRAWCTWCKMNVFIRNAWTY